MFLADLVFSLALLPLDAAVLLTRRFRPAAALAWMMSVPFLAALADPGFGTLRLAGHALFFHAPAVLALLALNRRRPAAARAALVAGALALAAVYVDAYHIEPYRLQISRHRLAGRELDRPLRVAIVADLQMEQLGGHERRALKAVMDEKPDLILLAGDYIQVREPGPLRRELNAYLHELGFGAPLGAYAVNGNTDSPGWEEIFDGLPVTVLSNRTVEVGERLAVTGLDVAASFDQRDGRNLVPQRPGRFHLVVGHAPDFAVGLADRADVDLVAAGHTHGGQVQLPGVGPLLTLSDAPRAWAQGAHAVGGATLYSSRGIGMERLRAPRLRFLCAPEIVVVEVNPR
jgi:hypothetical protein